MLTICWAAKGGSGTTVVAATLALSSDAPTLLVDLAGDTPAVLGIADPDGAGLHDWMTSEAPASRLERLEIPVDARTALLPAGRLGPDPDPARWRDLATALRHDRRHVVIDAGTGAPPPDLM
jgi:MinD-like ATPase involved in chromosome partitioning or flagellar assembly